MEIHTECGAITTLPWSENFDAYTGSTDFTTPTGYPDVELPVCWQFLNRSETSSTYPQVFLTSSPTYAVSGNCLFFKSSSDTPLYAVLPEFWDGIANLMLTFTYRNEGGISDGTLIVGYMTNPADAYTFTEVLTCDQTNTKTEKEVLFADAPAGSYIAFKYEGGSSNNFYLGIDNVSVNYPPTCMKPTALTFVSSTPTSATLGWTVGGTETAWQIAYSTDPAFDPDEVTPVDVTSNPATIDGLTASTEYYAYVRANCGNGDYSEWSYYYCQFATQCGVVVVDANHPFTEGFEGEDFPPYCWENIASGTTNQWNKGNYNHTEGGSGSAFSGYFGPIYLVMPDIQLPSNGTAQLTFWSYYAYLNDYGKGKSSVVLLNGDTEIELWALVITEEQNYTWYETTIDLTNYKGQTISLAFKYQGDFAHAWYVDDVEITVTPTFTKDIVGYEDDESGWYLIASPLADEVEVDEVEHLQDNVFDLYYFDQSREKEWVNYKEHEGNANPGFNLVSGKGYLYANSGDVTLTFTGTPYSGEGVFELEWSDSNPDENMRGWNLVGNPFTVEAAVVPESFCVMNEGGSEIVPSDRNYVEPMEGIFVYAEEEGVPVMFIPEGNSKGQDRKPEPEQIVINLSRVSAPELVEGAGVSTGSTTAVIDRAIVRFGEGSRLPKFQIRENSTKLYIPQDGKDYAIVSVSAGTDVARYVSTEIPVNFKAKENGTYTLTVSPTLNAQLSTLNYLHLIDNMTGADVDLLAAKVPELVEGPTLDGGVSTGSTTAGSVASYTFTAKTTDYASRFRLVFVCGDANDDNADAPFAFINNGNIIVSGEGTLQVIDVMGRVLVSLGGHTRCVSTTGMTPGVYVLRLINGNDVRVQKMVID